MPKRIFFFLLIALPAIITGCGNDDDTDEPTPQPGICNPQLPDHDLACQPMSPPGNWNGFTVHHFPFDSTLVQSEGNYDNSVRNGFWKFYNEDGDLVREGNYTNGRLDGFWKAYWMSGNLRIEGHFEDCVQTGFWKWYHDVPGMRVRFEGHMTNGEPSSEILEYGPEGALVRTYPCGP